MWIFHGKQTTATNARRAAVGCLAMFAILGVAAIVLLATGHGAFSGVALLSALVFGQYGGRSLRRYRELRALAARYTAKVPG
ncbi:MAG TPA: hypothetical protein VGH53_25880 [Streptosporangiaceae bacterium]|jgi:hypothetical protein